MGSGRTSWPPIPHGDALWLGHALGRRRRHPPLFLGHVEQRPPTRRPMSQSVSLLEVEGQAMLFGARAQGGEGRVTRERHPRNPRQPGAQRAALPCSSAGTGTSSSRRDTHCRCGETVRPPGASGAPCLQTRRQRDRKTGECLHGPSACARCGSRRDAPADWKGCHCAAGAPTAVRRADPQRRQAAAANHSQHVVRRDRSLGPKHSLPVDVDAL